MSLFARMMADAVVPFVAASYVTAPQPIYSSRQRRGVISFVSRDSATWNAAGGGHFFLLFVNGVYYSNGGGGNLIRSVDNMVTWTIIATYGASTIRRMFFGNGKYWAFTSTKIYAGTDPAAMADVTATANPGGLGFSRDFRGIYDPATTLFFQPGGAGLAYYDNSYNGGFFNFVPTTSLPGGYTVNPKCITTNGAGIFVIGSLYDEIFRSTSPSVQTSWASVVGNNTGHFNFGYQCAAYGAGIFVVGGEAGLVSSPDGSSWTLRVSSGAGTFRDVIFVNNTFIAMTRTGSIWMSADGITWTNPGTAGFSDALEMAPWSGT